MTSSTEDTGSGPYNPDEDPDADPGMIQPERLRPQPDQAEGEDEDSEDSEDFSAE
ncbi:hypothetical protein [Nocardia donostiensis]|uniref:hypothetical protein n=1 Tax=Nocardia donostiensis TaxID=1538463 RepID=UPI00158C3935|nr:hypothetical protein [Nocardia donostiensis]